MCAVLTIDRPLKVKGKGKRDNFSCIKRRRRTNVEDAEGFYGKGTSIKEKPEKTHKKRGRRVFTILREEGSRTKRGTPLFNRVFEGVEVSGVHGGLSYEESGSVRPLETWCLR